MKKNQTRAQYYSEDFKRLVVAEYLRTGQSKKSLHLKYGIRTHSGITDWLRCYGYADIHVKAGYLPPVTISSVAAKAKPSSEHQLPGKEAGASQQARIKELERQLEDAQLRAEAYSRMIALAEQEFNIPIRKKSSTK